MPKLEILTGQYAQQQFQFEADEVWIGSDARCGVCLQEPGISRHHARILCDREAQYWVEDAGGSFGTVLNGQHIERAMLDGGDELTLGRVRMKFLLEQTDSSLATPFPELAEEEHEGTEQETVIASISSVMAQASLLDHSSGRAKIGRDLIGGATEESIPRIDMSKPPPPELLGTPPAENDDVWEGKTPLGGSAEPTHQPDEFEELGAEDLLVEESWIAIEEDDHLSHTLDDIHVDDLEEIDEDDVIEESDVIELDLEDDEDIAPPLAVAKGRVQSPAPPLVHERSAAPSSPSHPGLATPSQPEALPSVIVEGIEGIEQSDSPLSTITGGRVARPPAPRPAPPSPPPSPPHLARSAPPAMPLHEFDDGDEDVIELDEDSLIPQESPIALDDEGDDEVLQVTESTVMQSLAQVMGSVAQLTADAASEPSPGTAAPAGPPLLEETSQEQLPPASPLVEDNQESTDPGGRLKPLMLSDSSPGISTSEIVFDDPLASDDPTRAGVTIGPSSPAPAPRRPKIPISGVRRADSFSSEQSSAPLPAALASHTLTKIRQADIDAHMDAQGRKQAHLHEEVKEVTSATKSKNAILYSEMLQLREHLAAREDQLVSMQEQLAAQHGERQQLELMSSTLAWYQEDNERLKHQLKTYEEAAEENEALLRKMEQLHQEIDDLSNENRSLRGRLLQYRKILMQHGLLRKRPASASSG